MYNWGKADKRTDFNPDHDSLFMRFEQLETLLDGIVHSRPTVQEALALVRLIRKQVLK